MSPRPPPAGRAPGARGERDLTSGPIGSTLLAFALPVLGTNILQSLNASANAIWVSHALGESALTAASNANIILFLLTGAVFGVAMAANIMIGQSVGMRDVDTAKRVVGTSTVFFVALSTIMSVVGWLETPAILRLVGTPPDAEAMAQAYLRVIFLAVPFIYLFTFLMMAQRGAGDSRTPFYFSLLMVVLDVALNPVFILGLGPAPRMGIAGSATATLISQLIALTLFTVHLYRSGSFLVLRPSEFGLLKPDFTILKRLVGKGLPTGAQMLVMSGASVVMISMVNAYGSTTAAGYGAAMQVWTYVQMPAMAIGAAVSSMAAQNVGAGRMDRVNRVAGIGSLIAFVFTATPVVVCVLAGHWILGLFLPGGSAALPIAEHINHIALWGFILFSITFVLFGVVRSTGAVWAPLAIMVIGLWVVRVPAAQLAEPYFGADAIWWSFPLGSLVMVLLAFAYYRLGNWRKARMLEGIVRAETPDTGLSTPAVPDGQAATSPDPSEPNRRASEARAE